MGLPRHLSGSLKQSNKKHKGERKRSNSQRFQRISKKSGQSLSKKTRRHIAKQQRQQKNKMVITGQKNSTAPLMCLILPLHERVDVELTQSLICKSDPNSSLRHGAGILSANLAFSVKYLSSPIVKRDFALVTGQSLDTFGCLDLARIADWIIFVLPGDARKLETSNHMELLTTMYAQGLPSSVFCVMSNVSDTKDLLSVIETKFPVADGKIRPLNSTSDAIGLLRHLSQSQKKPSFSTANNYLASSAALKVGTSATRLRCGMLVEGLSIEGNEDNEEEVYLKVEGLLRGWDLPLYDISQAYSEKSSVGCPFIHISGWGDFPLRSASWRENRRVIEKGNQSVLPPPTSWTATSGPNEELTNSLSAAWNDLQIDSLDNEVSLSDDSSDDDEAEDEMAVDAASGNDDAPSDSDGDLSEMDTEITESVPKRSVAFQDNVRVKKIPRSNLTTLEERIKAARLEQAFPDEVETPPDIPAKIRFSKYRGLPSFGKCCWSIENDTSLPYEYSKIFRFHNYAHNRRTMIKHTLSQLRQLSTGQITDALGLPLRIPSGSIANLTLGPITKSFASSILDAHTLSTNPRLNIPVRPLVLWSLLPYEHCMSVLHLTMQKRQVESDLTISDVEKNFDPDPVLSKEPMLFQVGIRRFFASPIYSQANKASNTNSKLEKFFTLNSSPIVSSMYAPVTYAPQFVLQFRISPIERPNAHGLSLGPLVATGSVLSVDPSRAIVKRILLSGHPFKIHKRSVIARYMFHTPEDIDYFTPIQLYTKSGAVGHIKQSVGTHGFMKCLFDKQLSAADVILMPLYKRVFPRMTYDCLISPKLLASAICTKRSTSNSDPLHGIVKGNVDSSEKRHLTSEEEAMFL